MAAGFAVARPPRTHALEERFELGVARIGERRERDRARSGVPERRTDRGVGVVGVGDDEQERVAVRLAALAQRIDHAGRHRIGPDEVQLGCAGQPSPTRQQAREASATIVLVGFTPADVTNTLPSAT